jgi:hypothetical protein
MNCEAIRKELVAYRDGELSERDRVRVATHLETCAACSREEAQLAGVGQLFASLERIAPSPDFAATFWRRLEQEGQSEQDNRLARWWREWSERAGEWARSWQLAPAIAAAASLLVFLGYMTSERSVAPPAPGTKPPSFEGKGQVPTMVVEQPDLFTNYRILSDLDKLVNFDEIAALDTTVEEDSALAQGQGEDLPLPLLEDPNFFVQYPILQKMEQLQNLETVLDLPDDTTDQEHRG